MQEKKKKNSIRCFADEQGYTGGGGNALFFFLQAVVTYSAVMADKESKIPAGSPVKLLPTRSLSSNEQ